jgi:hypothetical protein
LTKQRGILDFTAAIDDIQERFADAATDKEMYRFIDDISEDDTLARMYNMSQPHLKVVMFEM